MRRLPRKVTAVPFTPPPFHGTGGTFQSAEPSPSTARPPGPAAAAAAPGFAVSAPSPPPRRGAAGGAERRGVLTRPPRHMVRSLAAPAAPHLHEQ